MTRPPSPGSPPTSLSTAATRPASPTPAPTCPPRSSPGSPSTSRTPRRPTTGFHLAAKLSEAVDQVRRTEVTTRPELKHTRWLWLKTHTNLSAMQQGELHRLMRPLPQLATARALR
ncbi:MAG: transposase [Pseudonocardia sp.]